MTMRTVFIASTKSSPAKTSDPLMLEEMEKAIREIPRDAEVIDLLKNFLARDRLLRDNMAALHNIRNVFTVFFSAA